MATGFICLLCGQYHDIEMSFAYDVPDPYANIEFAAREARATLTRNSCMIDRKWFFIRCCLEVPILDSSEPFLWGLWAGVFEVDFDEVQSTWELEGRELRYGPYKARLANGIQEYPDSLNVKATLTLQPLGTRPLLRIDQPDHPLARDQKNGITRQRAIELASGVFHSEGVRHTLPI